MAGTTHLRFERDIAELQRQIDGLRALADEKGIDVVREIDVLRSRLAAMTEETYRNLAPMERVQVARHPNRPYMLDYVERIFTDWIELHGDRSYRDDQAIVAGWACLDGQSLMVIGQQKGRAMKENLRRNFGMPHPEGYRKALRLMKMAEKFGRPVVTVIDTPGAYPGLGSEERGIGEAIARNLREMAALRVPTVSVVIGEGMSGGALGIGVTDRILMLEHAVYSVISPEGCAAILWRSRDHREKAAEALRLTSSRPAQAGRGGRHHRRAGRGRPLRLGSRLEERVRRSQATAGRVDRARHRRTAGTALAQVRGDRGLGREGDRGVRTHGPAPRCGERQKHESRRLRTYPTRVRE